MKRAKAIETLGDAVKRAWAIIRVQCPSRTVMSFRDAHYHPSLNVLESEETTEDELKEARDIISGLLVGMEISDERWKPAADWLNRYRKNE